jgi:peptidoglycan/xylan/chitin deacetylase (PgdA/CDA1 family)
LATRKKRLLREALSRLLRNDWDRGYVVYLLAVIGADVHMVAAERRVSRAVLLEHLRDAVHELALLRLLQHNPSQGYLVVRLVVENAPADVLATASGMLSTTSS